MIVYAASDLIFATKIGGTADTTGVPSRPVRSLDMLRDRLARVDDGRLSEPVTGVIVDLELGETALEMIRLAAEESPAPPIVAFGSHVEKAILDRARQAGADHVMPRSQFVASLPALLQQLAQPRV